MHYAVIKENSKKGYDIYNWHDDSDDMSDLSSAELIGHVSRSGEIDGNLNDELVVDGAIQALQALGFHQKANRLYEEKFPPKKVTVKHPGRIEFDEEVVKKIIYNELEKFVTYEYAADIFMEKGDEILGNLFELQKTGYEWLLLEDIHRAIGSVIVKSLILNEKEEKTEYEYILSSDVNEQKELEKHLSRNGYKSHFDERGLLIVLEEEKHEVNTILEDRFISSCVRGPLRQIDITKEDIRCCDELIIEDGVINATYELYFEVDKYFGWETRYHDCVYINFYTDWHPDGTITASYSVDGDLYFHEDWDLTPEEKEFFRDKMENFCKARYGKSLYELYVNSVIDFEEKADMPTETSLYFLAPKNYIKRFVVKEYKDIEQTGIRIDFQKGRVKAELGAVSISPIRHDSEENIWESYDWTDIELSIEEIKTFISIAKEGLYKEDPEYGNCTTCEHYSKCNICSDCHEGSNYEYVIH